VHPEDGVFISADGESWARLLTAPDTPELWVPVEVDLAAAAATHDMPFNAEFQIKFQFYDDDAIPEDGYAIDEVQVSDGIYWRVRGLAASNDSPTGLASPTNLVASVANGTDVTYAWDLGDGGTATGAAVSHLYPALGTYTAVVTASNATSLMTASTQVEIIPAAAISGLQAENDSPLPVGTPVDFVATIEEGTTVSYEWDFGDNSSASGATVQHTYDQPGAYQAVVTATNTENSVSATTAVSITEMPECLQFEFGNAGEFVSFFYPVHEDFDILHHMPVDSVETDVMLGDDDSDSKTLHIEIRQNGRAFTRATR
jgi:PKD repeat protein